MFEFVEVYVVVIYCVFVDRVSRLYFVDLVEFEVIVNLVMRLFKGFVLLDLKLWFYGVMDVFIMIVCLELNKYVKYVLKMFGKFFAGDDMMFAVFDDLRVFDVADCMWRCFISIRSMIFSV